MTDNDLDHAASPNGGWSYPVRLIFMVAWLIIGAGLLWLARPIWQLVALSLIVAYLLQPAINWLNHYRVPRGLAALIFILLLVLIIALMPLILLPALFNSIAPISIDIPALWESSVLWLTSLPETTPNLIVLGFELDLMPLYEDVFGSFAGVDTQIPVHLPENLADIFQQLISSTTQVVSTATTFATNVIGLAAAIIVGVVLLFLVTLYLATDLPKLNQRIIALLPDHHQSEWRELWRRTGNIWNSFFRGQIVLSVVVGTAVWLGLTILGVPGAFVLGIFAAVLEIVPNLGPLLAAIPGVLLALLQGSSTFPELSHLWVAVIALGIYLVIQQLENYILVPRILGSSVGVHPVLILLGVTVFTIQLGILGAFIATPVIATLLLWFSFYHARILGRNPFPELLEPVPEPVATAPPSSGEPDENAETVVSNEPTDSETVAILTNDAGEQNVSTG